MTMAGKTPMWRRYLRLWGPNPRADVDAEISYHLDELVAYLIARGMTPDQANAEAMRRFGSVSRARAECEIVDQQSIRETRRRDLKDALWTDILEAGRGLRRSPGLTIGAAVILALGIGLNTATYSFNKALLFPTVPIGDVPHVVKLWSQNMGRGVFASPLSEGEIADLAASTQSFETIAAYAPRPMTITGGPNAERVPVVRSTINLFPLLQVAPSLGRPFASEDATRQNDPVAILSYRTWQNRFASDADVVGQTIRLDGRAYTIVGVMPERFWFESRDVEAWLPMPYPRTDGGRDARTLMAIARLKSGIPSARAQADAQVVAKRLAQEHTQSNAGWDIMLTGLLPFGPGEKVFFAMVTTLTGLLLAAGCAHIANLLLARGIERRGEIALRAALGASRGRILRQLFAESFALSLIGGTLSLLVTFPIIFEIRAILGPATPYLSQLSLDPTALLITGGFIVISSLLFGVAPALRLSAITATDTIKESAGRSIAGRRRPLTSLLIGFEVMVATLALIVTLLFIQAANNVFRQPFGFKAEGVVTFRIDVPEYKYADRDDAARVLSRILDRLQRMPSVAAAGGAIRMPLNMGLGLPVEPITIEDLQNPPSDKGPWAITSVVTPGYFEALGIARVDGRSFEPRDDANAPAVAIVSRSLARAYWPNQTAVGRRLRLADASRPWLTVIGVVDDVRPVDPTSPQVRQLYLPLMQGPIRALSYFVATRDDPAAILQDVRAAVREVDADLPVLDLRTLTAAMDDTFKGQRFGQNTMRVNAVVAVLLALTGVYSVVAFASARRKREIAIRVALGGRRTPIVTMLLVHALRPAFVGVAVGLVLAALASRAISAMPLLGDPLNPLFYGFAAVVLCAATAAASCFPAIRATRVDAAAALRAE
jgi:putative ABC transport system permease protein